jgi:branched-chain amino acid transport system ATP-binding protein
MSEFLLEIDHLSKAFGALRATDDVTLAIRKGETHALIGPNGAGKTTLVGQLTGELKPDAGRISFDGRDITALSTARRARLGLARSFQITSIFDSFTAEGNVALAVQATEPHSFRFWTPAERIARLRQPARKLHRRRRPRPAGHAIASRCRTASIASSSSAWRSPPAGDASARRADGRLGIEESRAMSQLLASVKGSTRSS